jgi:tetratricopeptide (TPR) repeat protein
MCVRWLAAAVLTACACLSAIVPANAFSRPSCFIAPTAHRAIDSLISEMNKVLPVQRHAEVRACEYFARGLLYHLKGETERAVADYSSAVSAMSEYGDVYAARGDAYEDLGQHASAARDYVLAAKFSDDTPDELTERCWIRALRGRPLAPALQDCNESLMRQPGDFNALASRGLVYVRMANYLAAIADCDIALQQKPGNASALFIRALAKLRSGDAGGGTADLSTARGANGTVEDTFAIYGLKP